MGSIVFGLLSYLIKHVCLILCNDQNHCINYWCLLHLTVDYIIICFLVQKNQRELTKMRKCLRPEELASHINQIDTNLQHEELEKSYQDVLADYRRVLERLAQA